MSIALLCLAVIGYFGARAEWQRHAEYRKANPKVKKDQAIVIPVQDIEDINDFEKIAITFHLDQGHRVVIKDNKRSFLLPDPKEEKVIFPKKSTPEK